MIGQIRKELEEALAGLMDGTLQQTDVPERVAKANLRVKLQRAPGVPGMNEIAVSVWTLDRVCANNMRGEVNKLRVELIRSIITWLESTNYRTHVENYKLKVVFFLLPNYGLVVRVYDGKVIDRWGCESPTHIPKTIAPIKE